MPMHPEYRKKWVDAGYSGRMGSAEVVPPPSAEFLRVYHITSAEYAISDLALRRLKLARFSDLNDPFELLALNVRDKPTRKRLAEFKTTYNATIGILCFSGNWTNPVLWSHYGNKHRGICLGFDLRRGQGEQQVRYADERIRAKLGDSNAGPSKLGEELQKELLCTKFKHWEYEEETRLFVSLNAECVRHEGNLQFLPFSSELELKEIVLGPQCGVPLDEIRKTVNACYEGVSTIKARLAVQSFNVVPAEKTVT